MPLLQMHNKCQPWTYLWFAETLTVYPGHWAELLCEREICLGIKCELTGRERWADLYDSSLLRMKTDEKWRNHSRPVIWHSKHQLTRQRQTPKTPQFSPGHLTQKHAKHIKPWKCRMWRNSINYLIRDLEAYTIYFWCLLMFVGDGPVL